MKHRQLYCPAHFGNSYEMMWHNEMRDMLAEAKHWGFNVYADWFDQQDMYDPYVVNDQFVCTEKVRKVLPWYPDRFWKKKFDFFEIARDAGLELSMPFTCNHVYYGQVGDDTRASTEGSGHVIGQLVCPSNPEGRRTILLNARRILEEFARRRLDLSSMSFFAYDFGGCNCEKCQPWIETFGRLAVESHELAKEFFPDIEALLIGWFWSKDEHERFKRWADAEAPGRFKLMAQHLKYGATEPEPGRVCPEGCADGGFVHIGYCDVHEVPRDVYGHWGAVMAPNRVAATVDWMMKQKSPGFIAYSEGLFDDVNKCLLAGLSSGRFTNARDILAAYAERYFGASGGDLDNWADWMTQFGTPFQVDPVAAREDFDRLARGAKASWRLDQIGYKLRLLEINAEIGTGDDWSGERLELVRLFWEEKEKLWRGVWGLRGARCSVFRDEFAPTAWYESWSKSVASAKADNAGAHMEQA